MGGDGWGDDRNRDGWGCRSADGYVDLSIFEVFTELAGVLLLAVAVYAVVTVARRTLA